MIVPLLRVLNCVKRFNLAPLLYHRKSHFVMLVVYVIMSVCCFFPATDTTTTTSNGGGNGAYGGLRNGHSFFGYQSHYDVLDPVEFADSRCIVVISMGKQAQESQIVERFVWSARNRGQWKGWIVVLTDAPETRYSNLFENNQKDGDAAPSTIVMNPLPKDWKPHLAEDMPYKRFKTNVLEYMDRDRRLEHVKLVYYLDVDIIVGNSLTAMMVDLEGTYQIPRQITAEDVEEAAIVPTTVAAASSLSSSSSAATTSNIWFFQGNFKNLLVQGGQFILDRRQVGGSQGCLEEWRRRIDSEPLQPKDQPHLSEMYISQQQHTNKQQQQQTTTTTIPCNIHVMEKRPHLFFPNNATVTEWAREIQKGRFFRKRKTLLYPTLVHIKNSGKVKEIDPTVERIYIQDLLGGSSSSSRGTDVDMIGTKIHFAPDDHNTTITTPTTE